MPDREKVIKGLTECVTAGLEKPCPLDCLYFQLCFPDVGPSKPFMSLMQDALTLLKEHEEQKKRWLQQIADNQLAVAPTGFDTEEELARRTGEWNGLQMAWDILTKEQ